MKLFGARELFLTDVPESLLDASAHAVIEASKEARERMKAFGSGESHDLFAHEYRACLERNWRLLASAIPKVTVVSAANGHGGAYHTEISVGRVVMTASSISFPGEFVRVAAYRTMFASEAQQDLFLRPIEPEPESQLYAILTYCQPQTGNSSVGYAAFEFPNRGYSGYLGSNRVDLSSRLADLQRAPAAVAAEEQVRDDALQIGVRKAKKPGGA